eukprot:5678272-Pyramimonas_sp.AAC.1
MWAPAVSVSFARLLRRKLACDSCCFRGGSARSALAPASQWRRLARLAQSNAGRAPRPLPVPRRR